MVGADERAVLGDFGLSRLDSNYFSTLIPSLDYGNVRWQARELLFPDDGEEPKPSCATDIWSFGMAALELLSEQKPFDVAADGAVVIDIFHRRGPKVERGYKIGVQMGDNMIRLLSECWDVEPSNRPTAEILKQKIGDISRRDSLPHVTSNVITDKQRWLAEVATLTSNGSFFL